MLKRVIFYSLIIVFGILLLSPMAGAGEITTETPTPIADELPKPTPPLTDVQGEKLITPGKGVGGVHFGMDIEAVENVFGRGEIRPVETDFHGNSTISLIFKDKNILFKFFNGQLFMIIIKDPELGTKKGVHVMGDIGDAIREFGSDFRQEKSLVQDPDPKKQAYIIYYDKDNIAFKCVGSLILEIHLKTPQKLKAKKL